MPVRLGGGDPSGARGRGSVAPKERRWARSRARPATPRRAPRARHGAVRRSPSRAPKLDVGGARQPSSRPDEPSSRPSASRRPSVVDDALELIGSTPLVRLARSSPARRRDGLRQARVAEPRRQRQGPPGARRWSLAAERDGAAQPGRHHRRGDQRQHRHQPGDDRRGARLPLHAGDARGHEPRAALHPARVRRRDRARRPASEGMAGAGRARRASSSRARPDAFMPRQFENPANPDEPRATRRRSRSSSRPAASSTRSSRASAPAAPSPASARVLRERARPARADRRGRARGERRCSAGGPPGMHGIQGLGAGFVPRSSIARVIDEVVTVTDVAAERMARRLAREEGLLVGPSVGRQRARRVEVAQTLERRQRGHDPVRLGRALSVLRGRPFTPTPRPPPKWGRGPGTARKPRSRTEVERVRVASLVRTEEIRYRGERATLQTLQLPTREDSTACTPAFG